VAALGAQLVMAGIAPSGLGFAPDSSMPVTVVSAA
jgi:N6-L-threonylcarbamoyladenine synthase